jgi:hypothetical protein
VTTGAAILFFTTFEDLCNYIKILFPSVKPIGVKLTFEEEMQFTTLNMGQADYFCLNGDISKTESEGIGQLTEKAVDSSNSSYVIYPTINSQSVEGEGNGTSEKDVTSGSNEVQQSEEVDAESNRP